MKSDGGPAFPVECNWMDGKPSGLQTGNRQGWATGMTLRDYFAAKAMQGALADPSCQSAPEQLAAYAYGVADAMLTERSKE